MTGCEECQRLRAETATRWHSYLTEKRLNYRRLKDPHRSLALQNELLKSYRLMAARERIHQAQVHPDQGSRLRTKDLDLIGEQT